MPIPIAPINPYKETFLVRRGRLVLGGAGLLLAVLVAGLWFGPGMLDWNRYRDGIAALASQQLGRSVHIGGAVSLAVLPQPILTAADITIDDESGNPALHARALRLRVALGSLFAGRVDARELTLQGADLHLPWPPPAGSLVRRPPSWLTGLQARVEDGRLQVGDLVVAGIDATVTTDPDTGTLSVAGVGKAGTRSWQFTARLTRPGGDGSAGLDASLDGQEALRDTGGSFSGQMGADGALSGRVAGRGPDLSLLMPAPASPWRGDGRLTAAGGLAVADELALEIGGAPARGAVALRVQPLARLDVAIAAGRLDLDAWLPALLGRKSRTLRSGVPTGIDLSAEAATLAGGTLRRLRGGFDLERGGGMVLRDVTAVLPGEARILLSGTVAVEGGARYDGPVRLEAPDLRGTIRWLERVLPAGVAALPPGVLRTANLSGRVVADAGQAAVSDLQGTLDGSAIAGAASVRLGARPVVSAGLVADRLMLDPWIADPSALLSGATIQAALTALRGMDADLKLQIGRAEWAGVALGTVALEMQTEVSRIALRRFEAQPFGAKLSVSGNVGENGRLSDGRVELATTDLAALRPALGLVPGAGLAGPLFRGPGSGLVLVAGAPDALAMRMTLEVGDLRLESQPTVNLPGRRWAGPLTLHHPGAPRLLDLMGFGNTAAWLGDGSLSLVGQVAMTPGRLSFDGVTVAAGALRAGLQGSVENHRVNGQAVFETLPLPLIYPRSPEPLPLGWVRDWQAGVHVEAAQVLVGLTPTLEGAAADLVLQDGILRLDHGVSRVAGGVLSGSLVVDATVDPPTLAVRGQASGLAITERVFDTPVDVSSGEVESRFSLSAAGYSPAALLATLGGQASVRVRDGMVNGFDLAAAGAALEVRDPREALQMARAGLLAGETAFSSLDASLSAERGVVTTSARLASPAGNGLLSGSVDLLGGGEDLRLTLQPAATGAPELNMRLAGASGVPTRTPELAGLARWLADRPGP